MSKAVCTIDGEIKDNSDSLEVTDKKKKGKQSAGKTNTKETKALEVNLYTPFVSNKYIFLVLIFYFIAVNDSI